MILTICFISWLSPYRQPKLDDIDDYIDQVDNIHKVHPDIIYDYERSNHSFLKYASDNPLDKSTYYLSWRYSGFYQNKNNYDLILMDYKTKQNEFIIDSNKEYIQNFYNEYKLDAHVHDIIYLISLFNKNREDYLEIETYGMYFVVKLSLFSSRGSNQYVHVDENHNLYLLDGICKGIAKFTVV